MGFATEDGKHEGWVAALFADGAISGSSSAEGFGVSYAADGSEMYSLNDWRPHSAVIGWVGACTCGWRTAPWTRVGTPAEEDLSARRAYGDYVWIDREIVTDFDPAAPPGPVRFDVDHTAIGEITHAEWKQHIEPDQLLSEITDLTEQRRQLDERLAAIVARARAVNATWEDIGRAAGITRQSAHERWSRPTVTAAGRR